MKAGFKYPAFVIIKRKIFYLRYQKNDSILLSVLTLTKGTEYDQ